MDQAKAMDNMYRYQRYIYDFTRKYYLLGRDRLIRKMPLKAGDNVLEIGCGTARNLILLAKKHPDVQFYGLDASQEMLDTAQAKIDAKGLTGRIILKQCLAEQLDYEKTFGLDKPFDAAFFSYSLSMIPPWSDAVDTALVNVKKDGFIHIVDFSDQRGLPKWFQWVLQNWLSLFGVHYPPGLLPYFEEMEKQGKGSLDVEGLGGYYAFLADFKVK